ncbi:hypothetical protein Bca52824_090747 [Brassica carinata]|uniref:Uncharacterized protein n=1 Tax=Brassica carinata TaxID=52824 RepID=A0A8X7NZ12_BRACI|nr:hypothetical protein Bca52824_090747 [Brassica carinata]
MALVTNNHVYEGGELAGVVTVSSDATLFNRMHPLSSEHQQQDMADNFLGKLQTKITGSQGNEDNEPILGSGINKMATGSGSLAKASNAASCTSARAQLTSSMYLDQDVAIKVYFQGDYNAMTWTECKKEVCIWEQYVPKKDLP